MEMHLKMVNNAITKEIKIMKNNMHNDSEVFMACSLTEKNKNSFCYYCSNKWIL